MAINFLSTFSIILPLLAFLRSISYPDESSGIYNSRNCINTIKDGVAFAELRKTQSIVLVYRSELDKAGKSI